MNTLTIDAQIRSNIANIDRIVDIFISKATGMDPGFFRKFLMYSGFVLTGSSLLYLIKRGHELLASPSTGGNFSMIDEIGDIDLFAPNEGIGQIGVLAMKENIRPLGYKTVAKFYNLTYGGMSEEHQKMRIACLECQGRKPIQLILVSECPQRQLNMLDYIRNNFDLSIVANMYDGTSLIVNDLHGITNRLARSPIGGSEFNWELSSPKIRPRIDKYIRRGLVTEVCPGSWPCDISNEKPYTPIKSEEGLMTLLDSEWNKEISPTWIFYEDLCRINRGPSIYETYMDFVNEVFACGVPSENRHEKYEIFYDSRGDIRMGVNPEAIGVYQPLVYMLSILRYGEIQDDSYHEIVVNCNYTFEKCLAIPRDRSNIKLSFEQYMVLLDYMESHCCYNDERFGIDFVEAEEYVKSRLDHSSISKFVDALPIDKSMPRKTIDMIFRHLYTFGRIKPTPALNRMLCQYCAQDPDKEICYRYITKSKSKSETCLRIWTECDLFHKMLAHDDDKRIAKTFLRRGVLTDEDIINNNGWCMLGGAVDVAIENFDGLPASGNDYCSIIKTDLNKLAAMLQYCAVERCSVNAGDVMWLLTESIFMLLLPPMTDERWEVDHTDPHDYMTELVAKLIEERWS